jgi:hypothetical protein
VRTYLADGQDAKVVCLAARKLREKNRTLSGDALGVEVDEPESDIVADQLKVMAGDSGLWCETAAERLVAEFPMRHADAAGESVSAAARARSIPSTDVRWPAGRAGTNRKGPCSAAPAGSRGDSARMSARRRTATAANDAAEPGHLGVRDLPQAARPAAHLLPVERLQGPEAEGGHGRAAGEAEGRRRGAGCQAQAGRPTLPNRATRLRAPRSRWLTGSTASASSAVQPWMRCPEQRLRCQGYRGAHALG